MIKLKNFIKDSILLEMICMEKDCYTQLLLLIPAKLQSNYAMLIIHHQIADLMKIFHPYVLKEEFSFLCSKKKIIQLLET